MDIQLTQTTHEFTVSIDNDELLQLRGDFGLSQNGPATRALLNTLLTQSGVHP